MWMLAVIVLFSEPAKVTADGSDQAPVPDKNHKCPVCGMVVHRYPDFLASITYADMHTVFFDGAKDMFKYLFNLDRYAPGRTRADITRIIVTEYYDMLPIDARTAHFVVGSDIFGPMGHELIPLISAEDANQFKADHKGRRVVTFDQVTPALIGRLD